MRVTYGEVMQGRQQIADLIWNHKQQGKFTVVDVGGAATGWSAPLVDHMIDLNCDATLQHHMSFDICDVHAWNPMLQLVQHSGKFDYCICTHTLEDIHNPYVVLDLLPQIAHAGIISMPSIRCELSHVESNHWRGFVHHRYLFGESHGAMMIAPKLPVLEHVKWSHTCDHVEEIRFEWHKQIPYHVFMNNYLGPNTSHVLHMYEQFIRQHT